MMLSDPHEGFCQLMEIFATMISLLSEQKKPELFLVQKKLGVFLGNQEGLADLANVFASKDWHLIDKTVHIKTLSWFCGNLCDLLNESAKK
jgi:hypothetical protein